VHDQLEQVTHDLLDEAGQRGGLSIGERDGVGRARLIRIEVREEEEKLFVATSPDMPRFQVIGLSYEELEEEVPASIRALYKLQHNRDVEIIALEEERATHPVWYAARELVAA